MFNLTQYATSILDDNSGISKSYSSTKKLHHFSYHYSSKKSKSYLERSNNN